MTAATPPSQKAIQFRFLFSSHIPLLTRLARFDA